MARPQHKHVLSTPSPRRARLVRMGLATSAVLVLAAPAAAVVWPDDEPLSTTTSATTEQSAPANRRVAPSVGAETWAALEDEPSRDERVLAAPLAVRTRPSEKARLVDVGRSEKVVVTGESRGRWAEVVVDDESRWVRRSALADIGTERRTERGGGEEPRRSPQVAGRKPIAGGADSKPQPGGAKAPAPETAPTSAAAAPAPATQADPAASKPAPPTETVTEAATEPTPTPSTTPPAPAGESPSGSAPASEPEPTEDVAQDPFAEPGPTLPPELEPVPDLTAVLE